LIARPHYRKDNPMSAKQTRGASAEVARLCEQVLDLGQAVTDLTRQVAEMRAELGALWLRLADRIAPDGNPGPGLQQAAPEPLRLVRGGAR
jgi:hypothetical protein